MNIPAEYRIGIGLGLVAIAAVWLLARNAQAAGKAIGGAAGNLASGAALGALTIAPTIVGNTASGYADWANSADNPLRPLGDWGIKTDRHDRVPEPDMRQGIPGPRHRKKLSVSHLPMVWTEFLRQGRG